MWNKMTVFSPPNRTKHSNILHLPSHNLSEEEEVDKMMEQKMKEEEERKRTKEIEERMSLEETKEQVGKVTKAMQTFM